MSCTDTSTGTTGRRVRSLASRPKKVSCEECCSAMAIAEQHSSQLTFFGRLANDLTRRPVVPVDVSVQLMEGAVPALQKDDGHFAFADTGPSATAYHIRVSGSSFETRVFASTLSTT